MTQENTAAIEPSWLTSLNPEQYEAVKTTDGALLVLSGAGTGKTSVLVARMAYILSSELARPWNCMAVTFTNRAAKEMGERLEAMIGSAADDVWFGTFHKICVKILRRHAGLLGFESNFTIIDTDDQLRLIKRIMIEEGLDAKEHPAQGAHSIIERWKDKGLAPDKVSFSQVSEYAAGKTLTIYKKYQDRLRSINAMDFGDLLLHCLTLFTKNQEVLAKYQNQFRYILVDEYQDTNVSQYLWLRLLAGKHKNICCVGDDDQSIYSWRGAEIENILRFEKDFAGAKTIRLERNYRSTGHILGAASGLISHNNERLGKTLRVASADVGDGEPVQVRGLYDAKEEARTVINEIENLYRTGSSLSQIAILVRAGFQMREFEEKLVSESVSYRVIGGPRFYERMEIRDAMAYLRLVVQSSDDLAFERIINKPKRGLGDATVSKVRELAGKLGFSMLMAAERIVETDELKPKPRNTLRGFVEDFSRWKAYLDDIPSSELVAMVLEESGYLDMWRKDKAPDAAGRVENLKELVSSIEEKFESLPEFLEHVSLVMENDESPDGDKITLMTLHAAKGLEFDAVFLTGWEEGLIPHNKAVEENGTKAIEEERRLAHVGITRARKRVFISFAANRCIFGNWQNSLPSRFVEELPSEHININSASGLYGSSTTEKSGTWSWSGGGKWKNTKTQQNKKDIWKIKTSKGEIPTGSRIFHQKFGYGKVMEADGDKLEIAFEKAGRKKIKASFVEKV